MPSRVPMAEPGEPAVALVQSAQTMAEAGDAARVWAAIPIAVAVSIARASHFSLMLLAIQCPCSTRGYHDWRHLNTPDGAPERRRRHRPADVAKATEPRGSKSSGELSERK